MQPITVAIAEDDAGKRTKFELYIQGAQGIKVLTNIPTSAGDVTKNRRLKSRANITATEDAVSRIRRLNPRILLANLKQCTDADCSMLVSLRHDCPETIVVLLADESEQDQEDRVIQALSNGARGYLNPEADPHCLSKAVHVIDRGEAWVPRKMLGKIMDQWCNEGSTEAHYGPDC